MINITCAWCLIANATLLNIEWPDLNSQYYATFINNSKSLSISGYFPNSRYFSFELYDLKNWSPYWDIHDIQINNDNNPYTNPDSIYNSSISYTINITNDLKQDLNNSILIYRIYKGINETGGVPLPTLSKDDSLSENCDYKNRPVISIQNTNSSIDLYNSNMDNNFYSPKNNNNLFENNDARYLVAYYNNSLNTFKGALITLKMPSYPKDFKMISNNDYQVRYYSLSVIDLSSPKQTTQTISDEILLNYSDNNFTTVYLFCKNITNISLQLYPPSEDSQCDKKFNYFGVLYRQLLPRFKFEIPKKYLYDEDYLHFLMQDYYPLIYWI